jgi:hypothetical protein
VRVVRGWLLLVGAAFLFIVVVGVADDLGVPAARALMGHPPATQSPGRAPQTRSQAGVSGAARAGIPAGYLRLYRQAAHRCPGLPATVLAAIGKVESDHGRARLPGVRSGANAAGAAGPMQFGIGGRAGNTWGGQPIQPTRTRPRAGYGVDGDRDGQVSVYDPRDAIPAAADYLCANGAPGDLRRAVYAYNHASWYVRLVLGWHRYYAGHARRPPR